MTEDQDRILRMPLLEALEHLLEEGGHKTQFSKISRNAIYNELTAQVPYNAEHIRKMILGERTPQPSLLEALAHTFSVSPTIFREYRRIQLNEALDADPTLVDTLWEVVRAEGKLKAGTPVRAERTYKRKTVSA